MKLRFSHSKFLFAREVREYLRFLYKYCRNRGYKWFAKFEAIKDIVVDLLYKRRGKYTRPFLHFGTIALIFGVITFGPFIVRQRKKDDQVQGLRSGVLTSAMAYGSDLSTSQSEEVKQFRSGEIITHIVQSGETFSSIAQKYGLQNISTILWENNLTKDDAIKPGQELRILPVDGVRHKVARGETIYTIGKLYGLDESEAQRIIDYPFNEFKNDETFELAVGSTLVVPGGVIADQVLPAPVQEYHAIAKITPNAGSVTATGQFVWPASGRITQGFTFYHKGFDIANRDAGPILAADNGTVIAAGWDPTGYGNKVMVDHGNGFVTLYGHLSVIQVQVGQTMRRGSVVGQMGSTGRSTGTHLHFEIRQGGVQLNPGNYLH